MNSIVFIPGPYYCSSTTDLALYKQRVNTIKLRSLFDKAKHTGDLETKLRISTRYKFDI